MERSLVLRKKRQVRDTILVGPCAPPHAHTPRRMGGQSGVSPVSASSDRRIIIRMKPAYHATYYVEHSTVDSARATLLAVQQTTALAWLASWDFTRCAFATARPSPPAGTEECSEASDRRWHGGTLAVICCGTAWSGVAWLGTWELGGGVQEEEGELNACWTRFRSLVPRGMSPLTPAKPPPAKPRFASTWSRKIAWKRYLAKCGIGRIFGESCPGIVSATQPAGSMS